MPQNLQDPNTGGLMTPPASPMPPMSPTPPSQVASSAPQGGQQPAGDAQQASPEEQAMFDMFVKNTLKLVYLKPTWEEFKQALSENDPVKGIGDTLGILADQVVQSAYRNGTQLTRDAIVYGLGDVVSQVVNDLEEAGMPPIDEKQMAGIVYRVSDMVRAGMQKRGEMDESSIRQDWAQLQQMNESGALGRALGQPPQSDAEATPPLNRKQRRALAASKRKEVQQGGY